MKLRSAKNTTSVIIAILFVIATKNIFAQTYFANELKQKVSTHLQLHLAVSEDKFKLINLTPRQLEVQNNIISFYHNRNFTPVWFSQDGKLKSTAYELLDEINSTKNPSIFFEGEFGKILGAYNNINPQNYFAQAGLIAQAEEAFTKAFFQLSQINLYGYVTPSDVPAVAWHLPSRNRNFVSALNYAINNDNIHSALLSILPQNPEYEALIHFKNKYEVIAQNGGWPTLPEEITKLELGDTSSNILVLRMRLIITDDLARQYEEGIEYDENIATAVSHYQKRNGLLVDGRIGKNTLENLNVPVEDRLRQLLVNIERYKWLPENQGEKYIWVNIPDYTLQYVENGQIVREHVVVTGAKKHQTPCFNSYIKNVVLNPYWNVPYSITKDEIAPKLSEDAEYLLNKNYEVLNGWGKNNVLEPGEELNLKSGNYRVRQKPGPGNALGRVKFNLPNKWSIYLHDTPSKSHFQRTHRAYSHGCVRVKDPRDLAAAVLNSSRDWDRSEIDEVINSGETKEIAIQDHVNVYIVYMTAFIDSDGNLQLREDVYGRDREIDNALSQI